jgi:hypothetical protein
MVWQKAPGNFTLDGPFMEVDMPPQISKEMFAKALVELGHDPEQYRGQKLSLENMSLLYELESDAIITAIDKKHISAHYDYGSDTVWIDALDAAHFFYCVKNEAHLYSEV